jgi:GntR family transcriptional regulator of vanillate catabolism
MVEGMAARLAAERGVNPQALDTLKNHVASIDALLDSGNQTSEEIATYIELNDLYHQQLVALSESFVIERMLESIVTLPFAAPNSFVIANSEITRSWKVFFVAQEQHRSIVEAIENHEGMRAESLAREHAHLSLQTLRTAFKTRASLDNVPGHKLFRNVVGD